MKLKAECPFFANPQSWTSKKHTYNNTNVFAMCLKNIWNYNRSGCDNAGLSPRLGTTVHSSVSSGHTPW